MLTSERAQMKNRGKIPSKWEQVELDGKIKRLRVENRNAIPSYATKHERPFSSNFGMRGLASLNEDKASTAR